MDGFGEGFGSMSIMSHVLVELFCINVFISARQVVRVKRDTVENNGIENYVYL